MQKVIKSNEFINFKNDLNKVIKKLNDVKDDVNVDVKLKYNLDKYEQIVEGSDLDVLTKYETWYDQLQKVVINNDNTIKQSNEAKEQLNELVEFIINSNVNDNIESITNKEIENNNELKETLNSIVDKMIDKETIIFNKNEVEFKRQAEERKHEFNEKLQNIKQMKYQLDAVTLPIEKLFPNDTRIQQDKEIVELIPSINKLKEWSGKQKCSILFDSNIDGDGGNYVLMSKVMNKKNLYFISFDNQNNVFGGYVDTVINTIGNQITDLNSFTFSLIRNGKMKNIKYNIKNDKQQNAFYLNPNYGYLYIFGCGAGDIVGYENGNSNSWCSKENYEYNGEQQPFIDNLKFTTKKNIDNRNELIDLFLFYKFIKKNCFCDIS